MSLHFRDRLLLDSCLGQVAEAILLLTHHTYSLLAGSSYRQGILTGQPTEVFMLVDRTERWPQ